MNFSNDFYKNKAFNASNISIKSEYTKEDAFFLLINEQTQGTLSNLCHSIKSFYSTICDEINKGIELSEEECYALTQGQSVKGKVEFNEITKKIIFDLAFYCLLEGMPLGEERTPDNRFNKSDWIGHSLLEGRLAGQFAKIFDLDSDTAIKMGILHDYGRKIHQDYRHVIDGFELLTNKGWDLEAIGCLTHSFLKGGRCACNDEAAEGFYVDDNGMPCWLDGTNKDDLTLFLEKYRFSQYDLILNICDLMTTSVSIVSPLERINDISKRRKLDLTNRGYFLAELTNTLVDFIKKMKGNVPDELAEPVKAAKGVTIDEIERKFAKASKVFYGRYQELFKNENTKLQPERYSLNNVRNSANDYER